jgi:hypothetical protein
LTAIAVHLVGILFGRGVRLLDPLGSKQFELEQIRVVDAPGVTHLQFRVMKLK